MTATPVSPDLTVNNPGEIVYLKGNEFTDGSIRLIIDVDIPEIQERKLGIWVAGELRLDASTLFLGRDVSIKGIGSHLQINSVEGNTKSLLLETRFNDGGTELPHTHVIGPLQVRVVFSSNIVGEIVTNLFELPVTSFLTAFRFRYYFKTGSVAATQQVTMTLTKGSTPGGSLVFTKTMPASQWPASTEVVVELDGALSLSEGAPLLLTIQSGANFSLIGDLANGGNFFAMDFQTFSLEDVIAIPTGTDRFLVDNSAEFMADNDGDAMMFGEQNSLSTATPAPPFPPLSDPLPPGI